MGFESWPSQRSSTANGNERHSARRGELLKTDANTIAENDDFYKRVRSQFESYYNGSTDPNERTKAIIERIDPFLQYMDRSVLSEDTVDEIKMKLQECGKIDDKSRFLDAVMVVLRPILNLREMHKKQFEDAQARAMNESGGFIEINRVLSYGKSGPIIHFHAPAGETVDNKLTLYRSGMKRLAEIVNEDPSVKEIIATSPLVAEHERLFSRAGFTLEEVSEEFKEEHFPGEERDVKKAWISREDFLKRFLKEDSE